MADERKVLAHSAEQIDEAVEKVLDGTVATKNDLQNKADASHTHDDRYYTENEVNDLLSEKAPAYTYGTEDLTAGTSPLETGKLYFVYE